MLFNVNDEVKIQLTPLGRTILQQNYERDLGRLLVLYPYEPIAEDENGWSVFQLWRLMREFGSHLGNGAPLLFQTEILIPVEVVSFALRQRPWLTRLCAHYLAYRRGGFGRWRSLIEARRIAFPRPLR